MDCLTTLQCLRAQAVLAVLVAVPSICVPASVQAQAEIEPCTGQPRASTAMEQPHLTRVANGVAQLSHGDADAVAGLEQLVDDAAAVLLANREDAFVDSLVFARAVERALEVRGGVVRAEPTLVTAWAKLRLAFANSLAIGNCLAEVETLLAEARVWPIADQDVAAAVTASHGGTLIQLGRLDDAIVTLRPFLDAQSAPHSSTELRARSAALTNLAVALRQSGERTRAARVYQQIFTLVLAPESIALVRTPGERVTYDSDIARLHLNLAALTLYNQDTEETWSHLERADAALERAGQTHSYAKIGWFRVAADYWTEVGDENAARETLVQGLALVDRVAPEAVAMRSELSRRLAQLGTANAAALQQLLHNEQVLAQRAGAEARAKVRSAKALADAYAGMEDWERAVEWADVAHSRMQNASRGPTVELAVIQQLLSSTLANSWLVTGADEQIGEAYEMSRAAARTVRDVGEREAVGCRLGLERNTGLVKDIRDWHGFLSSIMLQIPGVEDTALHSELANEVLSLVQAQETDRFGAAALRSAARRRVSDRGTVQEYEDLLEEKCALEEELNQLSAASRPDHAALAARARRVNELDRKVEDALALLDPILASGVSGGRRLLTRNELGEVLRPGEALLAFRIGDRFGVASLNIRHGDEFSTATVPLPKANFGGVAAAVSAMLEAIEGGRLWGGAGEALADALKMEELRSLMEQHGVEHVFVVPDGHLLRLPSHLLPVGTGRLGDIVDSSAVPSIWGFAALRQGTPSATRSRSVYAIGDPKLHSVSCDLSPLPETAVHREVMCLGKPGGLGGLLRGAQGLLGGPEPVVGSEATREAIFGQAPQEAGILLFGTHGLVPETQEISYLDEPALVLSPNERDLEDDGLLLASEVAELRFDDSWLAILAACRTGSPSGTDVSNGLSGLAWGFTAAGTDALVVTQWATYEDAAREVVLSMLQRMVADPGLTLAAALDDAMRGYAEAHPDTREWGSFAILGDGTVTMPPRE